MIQSPLKLILPFWRSLLAVFLPVILIPLPISGYQEAKCGYVIVIMAVFWMLELLPLSVVALIPVFAFPLLGVLSSGDVSMVYMKGSNMLFMGGLMVAATVEHCNLHKRIALYVILTVGQSPRRVMAGFMATTMFLSMWISNTATTAMMVPIIEAIVEELFKVTPTKDQKQPDEAEEIEEMESSTNAAVDRDQNHSDYSPDTKGKVSEPLMDESKTAIRNMIFLSVAYSANIGGTGSLTGTPPNLVLNGVLKSSYPDQQDLTFTSWMAYNVPGMLICTLIAWVWLQIVYLGCGKNSKLVNLTAEREKSVKKILRIRYEQLGSMGFQEAVVLLFFICLVILWLLRQPGFIPGWSDALQHFLGEDFKKVDDEASAIMVTVLLFAFPRQLNFWPLRKPTDQQFNKPSEGIITWQILEKKVPWGLILLTGSGLAMAAASKESGLSTWMGEQFRVLGFMPLPAIVFLLCLLVAMVTEVASNTATSSILMPVLNDLATSLCVNPLYLMLPAAICCSFAFMLPVATPPNAIVFGASGMKTAEMIKVGLGMNVFCVFVCTILINTFGVSFFDLNTIPSWMNATESVLLIHCYNVTK